MTTSKQKRVDVLVRAKAAGIEIIAHCGAPACCGWSAYYKNTNHATEELVHRFKSQTRCASTALMRLTLSKLTCNQPEER